MERRQDVRLRCRGQEATEAGVQGPELAAGRGEAYGEHLAGRLVSSGRQLGLDAVGICGARPFDEARRAIEDGLDAGRDAGMQFTYRNPARSCDPGRSLAGARALVVGAKGYARSSTKTELDSDGARRPTGSVAMYSWTDHYRALREALDGIVVQLAEEGWRAKVLADDNALVDRAAAVRAGIGWYGRNTNVLIPRHGSMFVLGSVVTDAPIESAEPVPADPLAVDSPGWADAKTPGPVRDGCGTCKKCVDACPTGALDGNGHLDARRCIAWLLQSPGTFPREFRVAAGNRIYGCDDCQNACPVNSVALRKKPAPPSEQDSVDNVDLITLLRATDQQLIDRFGRWYIPERDPSYIRRNALIALGNSADPASEEVADTLAGALRHREPLVRSHAVWAAARLGRADLMDLVTSDPDPDVLAELRASIHVEPRDRRVGR